MRKLIISLVSIVVIVALICLITPGIMGLWVEKRYHPQMMNQIYQLPGIGNAKLVKYKRGWFSSQADVRVILTQTDQPTPLLFHERIYNGPFIIARSIDNSYGFWVARALIQNKSEQPGLNFVSNTVWTLTNNLKTNFNIKDLSQIANGLNLSLRNFKGNMTASYSGDFIKSKMRLASASVKPNLSKNYSNDEIKQILVSELKLNNQAQRKGLIWYGQHTLDINKLILQPFLGDPLSIEKIKANMEVKQGPQDSTDVISSNHIGIIDQGKLHLNAIKINISLLKLDTTIVNQMVKASLENKNSVTPLLLELITKGLVLEIDNFSFKTPQGPVDFDARVSLPASQSSSANPAYLMHLLQETIATLHLSLPKAWLNERLVAFYENEVKESEKLNPSDQANLHIEHWVAHNILKESSNGMLSMDLNFKDGKLLVNGHKPALSDYILDNKSTAVDTNNSKDETTSHPQNNDKGKTLSSPPINATSNKNKVDSSIKLPEEKHLLAKPVQLRIENQVKSPTEND